MKKITSMVLMAMISCSFLFSVGAFSDVKAQPRAPHPPAANSGSDEVLRNDPGLKSKEVSVEVNANKNGEVYLDNTSRSIEIKTWDEPKVKVTTTIYYEGDANKLSDEEWFEKLNLSVKTLGSSVRIKSGTVSSGGSYEVLGHSFSWSSGGSGSGVAIFNSDGETIRTKGNTKRYVTICVPKEVKLNVESKYADITISTNLNKLVADITNGNLETQDIKTFSLRSKYANVATGDLQTGEIEFINGRFSTKDVEDLDIDTKYSTIEIASAEKINLVSTNDEYELDEVGSLQGRKSYGNLRIAKLNKSLELDGTNADLKIKNISASLNNIKLDNKYADIRLPLRNLKSYTVNYVGPYSTIYSNFEKKPYTGGNMSGNNSSNGKKGDLVTVKKLRIMKDGKEEEQIITENISGSGSPDDMFSATVGDGKGALINMKCQNCTVDFK